MSEDDRYYDISCKVKQHAAEKGVKVMKTRIIHNRFCDYIVGCKMLVRESDKNKLLDQDIWPEGMECRLWVDNPKNRSKSSNYEELNFINDDSSSISDYSSNYDEY